MEKTLFERRNLAALEAARCSTSFNGREAEEKLDAMVAILRSESPEDRLLQFRQEAEAAGKDPRKCA
ncbi:MAG: hypothetical protein A3C50_03190 [Candidatus Staskawiczbacteria bacterium RIFCSPHIGHO2_02_FULL_43_16]|uniref:Uncharacterized protein n=1 Tax=Candidatus Staskawiczbacteria bacterium RIFCSPHIGHO2_01_FULL_41_41 TaxID=1802203 RepID=A0A1G2HUU6_9BACT|nr:MAG: hypothetical protein A2822_03060 [Candidatus Staskawiczbacteria bacterium RIFCSPHIGHO2_01_FULL_41_41]OGZ68706.1 MAG: hypothetical protein A3C50_03190 [Candidatus Staskawiczbacteria bacterium RIFCSPHIGHO2_02_FULL_43_16]OGZ75169.1 MAG: hypothetical protein A3A12_01115 [Candidatus Staskawiczbacteria bacterium RIFCSPLOWO2_01_FULL_43_17b]